MPITYFGLEMVLVFFVWTLAVGISDILSVSPYFKYFAFIISAGYLIARYGVMKKVMRRQFFHCKKKKR